MAASGNTKLDMKSSIIWNTVGSVFYQGCLWLITVLVVRLSTGYQNSGSLAFAMSIGNIYYALGTYTMRTYQVADVENKYTASNYIALRTITVFGALVGCVTYGLIASPSKTTVMTVMAFLFFKADEAFVNVLYGIDQKASRLDYAGKSQLIRGIIVVAIFTAGMVATKSLALSLLAVFLCCLCVTFTYDLPHVGKLVSSIKPTITGERAILLLKTLLPTVAGNVVAGMVVSLARQYYGIVYGEEALGIYASVATPCVIVQVLAQNLYTPMIGPVAEAFHSKNSRGIKIAVFKLVGSVLGVAVLMTVALIPASGLLLKSLYGDGILPYASVLPFALVVTTEIALVSVITDLLITFGDMRKTFFVSVIALVGMAASIIPSTKLFDMNGINLSLVCGYSLALLYGAIALRKRVSLSEKSGQNI